MAKKLPKSPADFVEPLNINGLDGRMLRLPPPAGKNTEILLIYGAHSSLERWWGLALALNRYAGVTMPDLPGFGGMDSFYKIGKKPTVDNLADYLAAFVKLRYKRKKVVIAGMSFGFVIATRMLQRYPELTGKVSLLVSLVGFAHKDDFTFSRRRYWFFMLGCKFFSHRPQSIFFRYIVLHHRFLRAVYAKTQAKHKFKLAADRQQFEAFMEMEIGLWHDNDVRTYMYTTTQFLKVDNCQSRVSLPVWHVHTKDDHFFDHNLVEQHYRVIFKDFHEAQIKMGSHAPSVIASEHEAAKYIPPQLKRVLAKLA